MLRLYTTSFNLMFHKPKKKNPPNAKYFIVGGFENKMQEISKELMQELYNFDFRRVEILKKEYFPSDEDDRRMTLIKMTGIGWPITEKLMEELDKGTRIVVFISRYSR